MAHRTVCDRDGKSIILVPEEVYGLSIELTGPEGPILWAELDVCENCLPRVQSIIMNDVLTLSTPSDVRGGSAYGDEPEWLSALPKLDSLETRLSTIPTVKGKDKKPDEEEAIEEVD